MSPTDEHGETRRPAVTIRAVLGILLLIAIALTIFDNRDDVRVGWVVGDGEAPLAVVLALTAVAGAVAGWLIVHRPRRHHS